MGEIVYADLPEVGNSFEQDKVFGSVEAIKTVSDLFMPLSGKVIESNEHLLKKPTSINEDPYQQGWMIKIAITNDSELDSLLTAEQYKGLIN